MLESCDKKPICWICGYKFCSNAIAKFLGEQYSIILPKTLDMYFPSGLTERDYTIEIEHKKPFSLGGGDIDDHNNIAFSCGFCNRYKWKFISIYDVSRNLRGYVHPRLGLVSIPQPYWTIRLLALSEMCSEIGCTVKKIHNKLYVDLLNPLGSMVPGNMKIVCRKHRRSAGDRTVKAEDFKSRLKYTRSSII